jgi:hypothetical protein
MSTFTAALATRRGAVIAIVIALAAALGIAVYNGRDMFRPGSGNDVAGAFRNGIGQGINGIKAVGDTVASLFESRSPGERAEGALASLKHKRHPALHQRALPKVRRPPASPLAGIVGAAPIPPVLPPVTPGPLYNVVNGGPAAPVALSPPPVGPGGFFPGLPLPGGGGGIIVPPPAIVTPPITPPVTPPVIPSTPGVPEPSTWAMMLLGFAMIGSAVARKARPLPQAFHS